MTNATLLSRIASQIPDTVDLGDGREVLTIIIMIDRSMIYATDEAVQAIIAEARQNRLREKIGCGLGIAALAVAAWVFFVGFSGPAFAATGPLPTRSGDIALSIAAAFGLGVTAWLFSKPPKGS